MTPKANGPERIENVEDALRKLTSSIEPSKLNPSEHPALAACKKAADMVRSVHLAHAEQSETLAKHIEQIGETFMAMCKETADRIRADRILPEEMSSKMADELLEMGQMETERQTRVSKGLTAARDAIIGIDGGPGETMIVGGGGIGTGTTTGGRGGGHPEKSFPDLKGPDRA